MKKSFKSLVGILALGTLAASLVGCGKEEKKSDVIRVGFMPYYASVPLQVIKDEGLDTKYGFKMETILFPSGGPMAEAIGAGEWDIGQIGAGGMSAIPNYDAKLIADVQYEMDGAWILARPDSKIVKSGSNLPKYPEVLGSVDSIKDSTFLWTVGNISHYMGIDYLNKFGMEVSDINGIHMETAQIATAFKAGEGDVCAIGDPTAAMDMVNSGEAVKIGGLKQQGASQQDAMLVSAEYYENNKEDIVKFLKAWYEAAGMLNNDPNYEFEKTYKFYTEGGRTVTEASVKQECSFNSYVDAKNWKEKETGAWMRGLIECYVASGNVEQSTLDALKKNIKLDLIEEAMKK